jgi:hypothetical protein
MMTWGETAYAAPKEQTTFVVNLSGKKTHVGRSSGECFLFFLKATHEESHMVNFQVPGQRTEKIRVLLSFFMSKIK